MKTCPLYKIPILLAVIFCYQGFSEAAKPTAATPPAVVIDSVIVDWVNQKFIVKGSGFVASTAFTLGGTPVAATLIDGSTFHIPFGASIAQIITEAGNYNLVADGAIELSVFIESEIIDPAATGCPCTADWSTSLNQATLWGPSYRTTDCAEIVGPASNDTADIAGIVYSNSSDPTVFPQYPVGASYYPSDPKNSVCRMVELTGAPFGNELVNKRINEIQQEDCAAVLKTNVCSSVNGVPLP